MGALTGLTIVEQAGRLSVGLRGTLLAELGATVVRIEATDTGDQRPGEVLSRARKRRIRHPSSALARAALWPDMAATADVRVFSADRAGAEVPRQLWHDTPGHRIVCSISAFGIDDRTTAGGPFDEWRIQAEAALMAATGAPDTGPQAARGAIIKAFTNVNAAAAIVATLRVLRLGGPGQQIDTTLFNTALAMFGTHLPAVQTGKARGYRTRCRLPLCAPRDAFRCHEQWVQICVADAQWARMAELLSRPDLVADVCRTNAAPIDALQVSDGRLCVNRIFQPSRGMPDVSAFTRNEALRRLADSGIEVAPGLELHQVVAHHVARRRGSITLVRDGRTSVPRRHLPVSFPVHPTDGCCNHRSAGRGRGRSFRTTHWFAERGSAS